MTTQQQTFKLGDLHQKPHEIYEATPQLTKKRAEFLGEESPIGVLPPELLGLIFQFVRPSGFTTKDTQETVLFCSLKSVSKYWRQVLLSNPVIWTEVNLRISNVEPRHDANPLLPFIMHSGQLPLSLGIQYPSKFQADDTTLIHPSVDRFLIQNLQRITHLRLIFPPLAWFSNRTLLQHITHLTLYDVHSNFPPPLSLNRTVSLTVRSSPYIQLASAPLITTLNLSFVQITSSFRLISKCPNLRKLCLSCRASVSTPGFVDAFTIPHLQTLHWNISILHLDKWHKALLDHMYLPSLRTLEWEERDIMDYHTAGEAISGFFSRLPTTLTLLKFRLMSSTSKWSEEVTEDIYHLPPINCNLESIEFIECPIRFFWLFLRNLQTNFRFSRLRSVRTEKLRWVPECWQERCGGFRREMEEEISQACLSMLRNRMDVLDRRFTLVLEETDMGWWDKVRDGLTELRPGGCKMEIVEVGCKIILRT